MGNCVARSNPKPHGGRAHSHHRRRRSETDGDTGSSHHLWADDKHALVESAYTSTTTTTTTTKSSKSKGATTLSSSSSPSIAFPQSSSSSSAAAAPSNRPYKQHQQHQAASTSTKALLLPTAGGHRSDDDDDDDDGDGDGDGRDEFDHDDVSASLYPWSPASTAPTTGTLSPDFGMDNNRTPTTTASSVFALSTSAVTATFPISPPPFAFSGEDGDEDAVSQISKSSSHHGSNKNHSSWKSEAPESPRAVVTTQDAPTTATTTLSRHFLQQGNDSVSGLSQQQLVAASATSMTLSSARSVTSASTTSSRRSRAKTPRHALSTQRRPGRALQARLEKARQMQRALGQQNQNSLPHLSAAGTLSDHDDLSSVSSTLYTTPLSDNASIHSHSTNATNAIHDAGDHPAVNHSHSHNHNKSTNDVFEASLATGTVWAEMVLPDAVLAVAFSRPQPTLAQARPPFFLAVGTAAGTVHMTELLGDTFVTTTAATAATTTTTSNPPNNNSSNNISSSSSSFSLSPISSSRRQGDVNNATDTATSTTWQPHRLGKTIDLPYPRGGRIRSLSFSPNGQSLVVGADDGMAAWYQLHLETTALGEVVLRDVTLWMELERVDRVYATQFSPDGRYLAVAGFDGTVAIFPAIIQTQQQQLPEPIAEISCDGLIYALDWSPDSRYLAFGGSDKCCSIVDVEASWHVIQQIKRPSTVLTIQWYPSILTSANPSTNRAYLAVGSTDVALIEQTTSSRNGSGGDHFVVRTALDPRDYHLARKHNNNNSNNLSSSSSSRQLLVKVQAVCWSPNGSYFVMCCSDHRCTLVETKTFAVVHEITTGATTRQWTAAAWGQQSALAAGGVPPRRYLTLAADDGKVILIKAGVEPNIGASSQGDADDLSSSASSMMNGNFLLRNSSHHLHQHVLTLNSNNSSHHGNNQQEWVLKENAFRDVDDSLKSPWNYAATATAAAVKYELHTDALRLPGNVLTVIFSKGSKSRPSVYFAYATDDGLVTVRSTLDWKVVAELQFPRPVRAMAFSHGSRFVAFGCEDSRVYVSETGPSWSVVTKRLLTFPIRALAYHKDNARLAVVSTYGGLTLLDASDAEYRVLGKLPLAPHGADTTAMTSTTTAVSVDWSRKYLIVGHDNGTVFLWDSDHIVTGAWNQRSAIVATLGPTGSGRSGTLLHAPSVHTVAMGASSRFLAVGTADGRVEIYSAKGGWVLCHVVVLPRPISAATTTAVTSLQWSPTGRYLAMGGEDGLLQVLDTIFWAHVTRDEARDLWKVWNHQNEKSSHNSNQTDMDDIGTLTDDDDMEELDAADAGAQVATRFLQHSPSPSRRPAQRQETLKQQSQGQQHQRGGQRPRLPVHIAFSQDGRYLSCSSSDRGSVVVDTTSSWEMVFVLAPPATSYGSGGGGDNPATKPTSSASSTTSSSSSDQSFTGGGGNNNNNSANAGTADLMPLRSSIISNRDTAAIAAPQHHSLVEAGGELTSPVAAAATTPVLPSPRHYHHHHHRPTSSLLLPPKAPSSPQGWMMTGASLETSNLSFYLDDASEI